MKKYFILLVLSLFSVQELFPQSCNFNQDVITIDNNCSTYLNSNLASANQTVTARDEVDFKPGADIKGVSGETFDAKTENLLVSQLVNYLTGSQIIDGTTRALDKSNYIPGSIGGTIDISPSGAATGNFPIAISPGSHGMQPKLSIVYNSQSGNDILGFGWHLSGLSSITRVNKNPYYNGTTSPVTLSSSNVFSLDGQRLIPNNGNYSPENNPFSVIQYNSTNDCFKLTTKDGMVIEYGNSASYKDNSKFYLIGSSITMSYALSRITDQNGNYIQYYYAGDNTTGEYRIDEIDYTGNGSIAPYNKVLFYYDSRSDINISYVAGNSANHTLLLSSIKIFAENLISKDYEFKYFYDGLYSKLNQISLTADGVAYNPTIINWKATTPDYSAKVTDAGATLGSLNKYQLYFGDFNGDGITDVAQWDRSNTITVKIGIKGGGYNTTTYNVPVPQDATTYYDPSDPNSVVLSKDVYTISDIYIADWNNDGNAEIVVHYTDDNMYLNNPYAYNPGDATTYNYYHYDYLTAYSFNNSSFNACIGTNVFQSAEQTTNDVYQYLLSDFDGDGTTDVVIVKNGSFYGWVLNINSTTTYPVVNTDNSISINNIAQTMIMNFDGSGQPEFLALTRAGFGSIWKYNGSTFKNVYGDGTSTTFAIPGDLFLGDFNGDGVTDYLAYANNAWNISYGTGTGFTNVSLPSGLNLSNYEPAQTGTFDMSKIVSYEDFNVNDKILEGLNNYNSVMYYKTHCNEIDGVSYLINDNESPSVSIYYPPSTVFIDDINNDGKADIIYTLNGNINVFISNGLNSYTAIGSTDVSTVKTITDINKISLYAVDLNGDGQKEIIYGDDDNPFTTNNAGSPYLSDECNWSYTVTPGTPVHENYQVISFNNNLNTNLYLSSITDGNNINSAFTFSPTFTNTSGVRNYPQVPITRPMILATELTKTDLNTSTVLSDINYNFTNGYFHAQGKGFLGFSKVTSSDSKTGTSKTNNYSFTIPGNSIVYYTWLSSQSTSINNNSTSTTTNTLDTKGDNVASKLFYPYVQKSVVSDVIKGYTTTNTIVSFDASMGRVTDETQATSDGWTIETKPSYTAVTNNISGTSNTSVLNQVVTNRTKGSDTYSYTTLYGYDSNNPMRLNSITNAGVNTKYNTFDNYGNVTNTSYIASDGTRTTSCTFDTHGRFVTSSTDALNYTSYATYRAGDGTKLTETDINGLVTNYNYTASSGNYISSTTLPDGRVNTTTLGWDPTYLYYTQSQIVGGKTIKDYFDAAGHKGQEDVTGYNGKILTTKYIYTNSGWLKYVQLPGYTANVQYSYNDPYMRVSEITGPNMDNVYSYSTGPYTISVTNKIVTPNITTSQSFDGLGNEIQAVDAAGKTITYNYSAKGKVQSVSAPGSNPSMTYDPVNLTQLSLTDPDAGTIFYTYNGFGQLVTQTDNANNKITFQYDVAGRLVSKTGPQINITYAYFTDAGKLGLLKSMTNNISSISETYNYDNYERLNSIITTDGTNSFSTSLTYNSSGNVASATFPTGLQLNYSYDNAGNLMEIDNAATKTFIWKGVSKSPVNKWTNFSLGNGLNTVWGYDANNMINSIQTGTGTNATSIQNLGFTFNNLGDLTNRKDNLYGLSEDFGYTDGMDRLNSAQVSINGTKGTLFAFNYKDNGNIDNTTLLGTYSYGLSQPHAVSGIGTVSSPAPSKSIVTSTTFNAENKIAQITGTYTDGTSSISNVFTYGPSGNRYKVDFTQTGTSNYSKIYVGNSEFVLNSGSITDSRTFIYAPTGICAVYEKDASSNISMHYVHTDYLGSWLLYTDITGNVEKDANSNDYRYSYDAWGRPRDPKTWQLLPVSTSSALTSLNAMQPRFDRGYTGHEQMAGFGLINMNGRLYDPYLQRFLSPDNVIQNPEKSQNYNRYSYCMNNPLKYTDPTGSYYITDDDGNLIWVNDPVTDETPLDVNVNSVNDNYNWSDFDYNYNYNWSVWLNNDDLDNFVGNIIDDDIDNGSNINNENCYFVPNGNSSEVGWAFTIQCDKTTNPNITPLLDDMESIPTGLIPGTNDANQLAPIVSPTIDISHDNSGEQNNSGGEGGFGSISFEHQLYSYDLKDLTGGILTVEASTAYIVGGGNSKIKFNGAQPTWEGKLGNLTFSYSSDNTGVQVSYDHGNQTFSLGVSNKGLSYGQELTINHYSLSYAFTYKPNLEALVITGIVLYETIKWSVAILGAPETFGGSLGAAAALP